MTVASMACHSGAELRKLICGRAMSGSLAGGVLLCALGGYGFYSAGGATEDIIRAWMMMLLFSAIAGALIITRDYTQGTISRTVLAYGGRNETFAAKLAAAALTSLVFAAVAIAGAWITVMLTAGGGDHQPMWTDEAVATFAGVGTCVVLAGLWGLAIGWLVRNQTLSVLVILVAVLGVEPAVQRWLPAAARFLFTIALSSIYRDPKPNLLPVGAALAVAVLWIVALAAAGRAAFLRRDLR